MKKAIGKLLIISLLVALLVGCGNGSTKQIPEIVFMCDIDYSEIRDSGKLYATTFIDKNGNLYFTDDSYVCSLKYDELITEYAAGNLEGKIKLQTSCNADVIAEKYKELLEVAANKEYELMYPGTYPDVLDIRITWYGIFYDKKGVLDRIELHVRMSATSIDSNDETANELYRWYTETSPVEK